MRHLKATRYGSSSITSIESKVEYSGYWKQFVSFVTLELPGAQVAVEWRRTTKDKI